jgi:hypothetical protein
MLPGRFPGAHRVEVYFRTVRVEARVRTAEPAARLDQMAEITERRCPVRNLLSNAGVVPI